MKRFLAVLLTTLGISLSFSAQEHTKPPSSTTQSSATKSTPQSSRRTNRRRTRRTPPRTAHIKMPPPVAAATAWSTFTSAEGRFSVLMPGQPTIDKKETVQSEHGPYTTHLMVLRDTRNVFIIGWADYDPSFNFNRRAEMEMNRDVFVTDMKAKLLNSREVILDGYRAIEFTAETTDKIYKSRIYMVGRRPYQIVIGSPKGVEDSASIDRFLNSFKVSPY